MRLVIDGRTIDLDETVERVVIEKSAFGAITITSHLGVKKQVIHAAPVDHTAFRDAVGVNRTNRHSYQPPADVKAKPSNGRRLDGFAAPGYVPEKQKATWKGKTCASCGKSGQGTRAKACPCGVEFPPTTRIRN